MSQGSLGLIYDYICFLIHIDCHPIKKYQDLSFIVDNLIKHSWISIINENDVSRVSCKKGPTLHAYAWQIGPFWRDTLDIWPYV